MATKPASATSISSPCTIRFVLRFGSLRPSARFQTPVTVLTPNSTPVPAVSALWAVREPLPLYSCWPTIVCAMKSGSVA